MQALTSVKSMMLQDGPSKGVQELRREVDVADLADSTSPCPGCYRCPGPARSHLHAAAVGEDLEVRGKPPGPKRPTGACLHAELDMRSVEVKISTSAAKPVGPKRPTSTCRHAEVDLEHTQRGDEDHRGHGVHDPPSTGEARGGCDERDHHDRGEHDHLGNGELEAEAMSTIAKTTGCMITPSMGNSRRRR